jgi:iron complex outermembrane receptor protein
MTLNRSRLHGCTAIGALAIAMSVSPGARAQTAGARPSVAQPEQVIVTARRRAENIQKVPVAVTAISGANLKREHIVSQYDLNSVVPSLQLSISAGGGQNQSEIALRGQRQGDTLPSLDPSVGVYFGDIIIERPYGFNQQFFDLSNLQVLKGPQGTLFGRNTTGGNILLVPNLPTDTYTGMLHSSLGDYDLHEVDGWVNLPFNDQVQLRIAGQHTDRDGYIHDLTTGKDDENVDEQAMRASLRIKITDDITNVTVANYSSSTNNGTGYRMVALGPPGGGPNGAYNLGYVYPPGYGSKVLAYEQSLPFYDTATSGVFGGGYAYTHVATVANTTTWSISDELNFKNIIGYDHYTVGQGDQVSGSLLPMLAYAEQQGGDQVTEEAQVYGKVGHLNYIGGLYFFQEKAFSTSYTPEEFNPFIPIIPQEIPDHDTNRSYSVFGQATYDFSDWVPGLSGTFGGRETWDQRNADFGTIYSVPGAPFAPLTPGGFCAFQPNSGVVFQPYPSCRTQQSVSFNQFTYNVDIDYHFNDDVMAYFAHRLGYRAGGFGTRAVNAAEISPFLPETVNDYELGLKANWHLPYGMFLRTNAAIFDQDYTNMQRLVPVVIGGAQSTDVLNVGSATINGAELETTFIPVPWLNITGFFSQVQPKYNQFIIPAQFNPLQNGQPLNATKTAVFSGFPRTSFGLTARATLTMVPEQYGDAVLQINYYHQSGYMQQDSGVAQPYETAPGYGILNFRAEWNNIFGSKFDLAAYVTNLTDNHYIAATYTLDSPSSLGFASEIAAPPRMFGFEGTYHFGQ